MKAKAMLIICLSVVITSPCFASNSCPDLQEAVASIIKKRHNNVTSILNISIPDPEEVRGEIASCLGSISSLGNAFSLGVSVPSMDSVITNICGQVDSMMQSKINDAHNQVLNDLNALGGNNPFKVYGTGGDYVLKLKNKLK